MAVALNTCFHVGFHSRPRSKNPHILETIDQLSIWLNFFREHHRAPWGPHDIHMESCVIPVCRNMGRIGFHNRPNHMSASRKRTNIRKSRPTFINKRIHSELPRFLWSLIRSCGAQCDPVGPHGASAGSTCSYWHFASGRRPKRSDPRP